MNDAQFAANHFAWLILAALLDRAMFYGTDEPFDIDDLNQHADEGVRVFLAAYDPLSERRATPLEAPVTTPRPDTCRTAEQTNLGVVAAGRHWVERHGRTGRTVGTVDGVRLNLGGEVLRLFDGAPTPVAGQVFVRATITFDHPDGVRAHSG